MIIDESRSFSIVFLQKVFDGAKYCFIFMLGLCGCAHFQRLEAIYQHLSQEKKKKLGDGCLEGAL
jgi:hypothetical protein